MSTETVLTDAERRRMAQEQYNGDPVEFARAIEQAVLQSEQVRGWKRDAEAFRLMVSRRLTVKVDELGADVKVFHSDECLAWPSIHHCKDDSDRTAVTRDAIRIAIAAMERKT